MKITIPLRLETVLNSDKELASKTLLLVSKYQPILVANKLEFFPEYTDHGFEHINAVLSTVAELIPERSWQLLNAKDASVLIQAIILHDLGMHIGIKAFRQVIAADSIKIPDYDTKSWRVLWSEFIDEAIRLSERDRVNIFGTTAKVTSPNFDNLTDSDRRLIGEFIRRHHPRLCHEISLGNGLFFDDIFLDELIDLRLRDLAGLVGRSHGMNLRDIFPVLMQQYSGGWKSPDGIKVVYLMILIRIGDYLQIKRDRTPGILYRLRDFKSPISKTEWNTHACIEFAEPEIDDTESLNVHSNPKNVLIFLKVEALLSDIQSELDKCWAILGEVYSNSKFRDLSIAYRRLRSNVRENESTFPFLPKRIQFTSDGAVLKLLIKPLYNNEPSSGVREMLQNAIDACRERQAVEPGYDPKITISLEEERGKYFFSIEDNGIGMNEIVLVNYFFKVGCSYRESRDWIRRFTDDSRNSTIVRTGKFGVGALAAFLLGDVIELKTKHLKSPIGLSFDTKYSDDSIEVSRVDLPSTGTKIRIQLHDHLVREINHAATRGALDWFSCYVSDNPGIKYEIPENLKSLFTGIDNNNKEPLFPTTAKHWTLFTKDHIDYNWTFRQRVSEKFFAGPSEYLRSHQATLTYNGFVIPSGYAIKDPKCPWNSPHISIIDRNGDVSLSLDRNSLYNDEIPAERDLLVDVCKEIMSHLFAMDFENVNGIYFAEETQSTIFPGNLSNHIFFHKDGYILNTFSVFQGLKIDSVVDFTVRDLSNFKGRDFFGERSFYRIREQKKFSKIDFKKAPRVPSLIYWFSPTDSFNSVKNNNLHSNYGSPVTSSEFNEDLVQPRTAITNRLDKFRSENFDPELFKYYQKHFTGIQEARIQLSGNKKKEFWLFREVLLRYLEGNFIIPYSFAERKKSFERAFREIGGRIENVRKMYKYARKSK